MLDLAEILSHRLDFDSLKIEPISFGEENSSYHLLAPSLQYFLRVYSHTHSTTGIRKKNHIAQELRLIEHLAQQGIPTPRPIADKAGKLIFSGPSNQFATLFEFVNGHHPQKYDSSLAKTIGRLLRQIRKASHTFSETSTRTWIGDTPYSYVEKYRSAYVDIPTHQHIKLDLLANQIEDSHDQLIQLERGFIHGDIKLDNLLFSADGELKAVIDFDDFRQDFFIADLARTLMHDLHDPQQNAIRAGCAAAMIDGYAPDQPEFDLLPIFLKARFLYDATTYLNNGLTRLVDELLLDEHLAHLIFT